MTETIPSVSNNSENEWPAEGVEFVSCCPVCGSDKRDKLYDELTDIVFACAPGRWTMQKCTDCHSAYLNPRPTQETIHLAYQTYYTHSESQAVVIEKLSIIGRFMRAIANGYRNHRYGGQQQPAYGIGRFVMPLLPRFRRSIDAQLRNIPRVWEGARLLDAGFGSGAFLDKADKIGWIVSGVDPDLTAVENAQTRGLDVRQGGIEAYSDEKEVFDLITMSHVIEHVYEPGATLRKAFQLLKPGGYLYLDTPNVESFGHKEFGEFWRGLEVPRHLAIFSYPALENTLVINGFKSVNRIFRPGVYASISAKSRALLDGKDPYKYSKFLIRDYMKGIYKDLVSYGYKRKGEYITVMARKPITKINKFGAS